MVLLRVKRHGTILTHHFQTQAFSLISAAVLQLHLQVPVHGYPDNVPPPPPPDEVLPLPNPAFQADWCSPKNPVLSDCGIYLLRGTAFLYFSLSVVCSFIFGH